MIIQQILKADAMCVEAHNTLQRSAPGQGLTLLKPPSNPAQRKWTPKGGQGTSGNIQELHLPKNHNNLFPFLERK
eukprot:12934893-Prorocentrum_lima.AAC.1